MASLPESSTFDAGVYQLELTDPVIGGPSGVSNAPLKNLANRTKYLKDHVDALESSRAPLASPAFTGAPTAPTAPAGTNTQQLATTAFVKAAVDAGVPSTVDNANKLGGVAADQYALKNSPAFSGNPTAPTAPQFDSDTQIANTEWVNLRGVAFNRQLVISSNTVLNAASHAGSNITLAGASPTITLPGANTCAAGTVIAFTAHSGAVIQPGGADILDFGNGGTGNSFSLAAADTLVCVSTGFASWRFIGGTARLKLTGGFAAQMADTGYQRLPSGLILQWGISAAIPGDSQVSVTFPVAFPNSCFNVTPTVQAVGGSVDNYPLMISIGLTGATLGRGYQPGGTNENAPLYWTAIGN